MRKLIIVAILFINSLVLYAHNAQISTVALVQGKDYKWHLIISAGLSAYQFELKNNDPSINLDSLNADKFQAMIVQHLRENIKITPNNEGFAVLKNGKVILGHQTDINFEVEGMPHELTSLDFQHLGFATLKDHSCIFKIINAEKTEATFILQNDNKHTINLELKNNSFIEKSKGIKINYLIISILGVLSVFIFIVYSKKQ